jgi:hypothetical protein
MGNDIGDLHIQTDEDSYEDGKVVTGKVFLFLQKDI